MSEVRTAVHEALRKVAAVRGLNLPALDDDRHLVADLGLKSLDLAHLVALLETKLGFDPFAERVAITSVKTVGDLCAAYSNSTPDVLSFEDAQKRGAGRRQAPRRKAE